MNMMQHSSIIWLLVSSIPALILGQDKLTVPEREPVGPRFCESLCLQTSGCSVYGIEVWHLACYLSKVNQIQSNQVSHKDNTLDMACPNKSRLIQTKTKNIQCVKVERPKTKFSAGGLFVTFRNRSSEKENVFLLHLKTSILEQQPNFTVKNAKALVYVETLQRMTICLDSKIISVRLDGSDVKTLLRAVMCKGLALDTERQLLFLATDIPHRGVAKMAIKDYIFKYIMKKHGYRFKSIAVDSKQKVLYVSHMYGILKGMYNGDNVHAVYKGDLKRPSIGLDTERSLLYVCASNTFFQITLMQNRIVRFPPYGDGQHSVCYFYRRYLYVLSCMFDQLTVKRFSGLYSYSTVAERYFPTCKGVLGICGI